MFKYYIDYNFNPCTAKCYFSISNMENNYNLRKK